MQTEELLSGLGELLTPDQRARLISFGLEVGVDVLAAGADMLRRAPAAALEELARRSRDLVIAPTDELIRRGQDEDDSG